jgi:hypothetical protein
VLLNVPDGFVQLPLKSQVTDADRLLAAHIWDRARMSHGRELSPLPVLGVPGWWNANGQEGFYDDTGYFRPGRERPDGLDQAASSSV